jgi:hypothetical protein
MSRTPSLRRRLLVAFAGAMLLLGLGATGAVARGEAMGNWGTSGREPAPVMFACERVGSGRTSEKTVTLRKAKAKAKGRS